MYDKNTMPPPDTLTYILVYFFGIKYDKLTSFFYVMNETASWYFISLYVISFFKFECWCCVAMTPRDELTWFMFILIFE